MCFLLTTHMLPSSSTYTWQWCLNVFMLTPLFTVVIRFCAVPELWVRESSSSSFASCLLKPHPNNPNNEALTMISLILTCFLVEQPVEIGWSAVLKSKQIPIKSTALYYLNDARTKEMTDCYYWICSYFSWASMILIFSTGLVLLC